MLPEERLLQIVLEESSSESAVNRLIREANLAGGMDNITALVAQISSVD